MRRYIFKILLVLFVVNTGFSQNTATDFTTDDCNGISHNLFDSLNAGNVIVIAWVMPCGPCATYASPAYSAVQSFASSHPGKVDFYLVDDFANTACPTLVNWGITNNMPLNTTFSSSDISMSDYGTNGMPKVVVLGGANHAIYYNDNDDKITFIGVQTAINDALSSPLNIHEQENNIFQLSCFPNPANDFLRINYKINKIDNIKFQIVNVVGETVLQVDENKYLFTETGQQYININNLKDGVYFLNAYSKFDKETIRFIIDR